MVKFFYGYKVHVWDTAEASKTWGLFSGCHCWRTSGSISDKSTPENCDILLKPCFERMRTCAVYVYQTNGAATLTSHTSKGITLHSQFLYVVIEFYREKSFRCGINLVEHSYLPWLTCIEVRRIKFFCPVMAQQRHRGTHIFTSVHMNSPSLYRFPGMSWKVTQSGISMLKKISGFLYWKTSSWETWNG